MKCGCRAQHARCTYLCMYCELKGSCECRDLVTTRIEEEQEGRHDVVLASTR